MSSYASTRHYPIRFEYFLGFAFFWGVDGGRSLAARPGFFGEPRQTVLQVEGGYRKVARVGNESGPVGYNRPLLFRLAA